jgi:WD40 repeat protein
VRIGPFLGVAAVGPDAKTAVIGGSKGWLSFVDPAAGRSVKLFSAPAAEGYDVVGVRFTGDGRHVLSVGEDGYLRRFDSGSGREVASFSLLGHFGKVLDLQMLPGGTQALTCSEDRSWRLWDVSEGRELRRGSDDFPTRAIGLSRDGSRAVLGMFQKLVVWDVAAWKEIRSIPLPKREPASCRLTPDGKKIAVFLWESRPNKEPASGQIVDADSGQRIAGLPFLKYPAVSPDGEAVAGSTENGGEIQVHSLADGKQVAHFSLPPKARLRNTPSFSPDGNLLALCIEGVSPDPLLVYDWKKGALLKELQQKLGASSVRFLQDGKRLVTGARLSGGEFGGCVRVWDLHEGREVWQSPDGLRSPIELLAPSEDGKKLLFLRDDAVRVMSLPDP